MSNDENSRYVTTDNAGVTSNLTTGESQSTPAASQNLNETPEQEAARINAASGDPEGITAEQVANNRRLNESLTGSFGGSGAVQAPTSGGVGAGTSSNASDSRGPDNTPPTSRSSTQQAINTAFANQTITPRPNVLDQYASYTYAISWWLLTPEQYNNLGSGRNRAPAPGTGNWTLLVQSGGAPIAGRSQFFPDDFYFDDLEIESFLMGKGTNMSTNAMEIRFKVVEPNGITLIQRLYEAVSFAYKNPSPPASRVTDANVGFGPTVSANQTSQAVPNYAAAQYCLTIEFYGYDSQGNLVAPATGSSGTGPQAVIKKYYPFLLRNITFRTQANQVEYHVVASPVPYDTGTAQARGTIPFNIALAGTTVSQLLQGGPLPASTNTRSEGRTSKPAPTGNRISDAELDAFLTNAAELDRRQSGTVDALSAGGP